VRRSFLAGLALSCVALLAAGGCARAEPPPAKNAKSHPPNHLLHESSPYLLQHAHNPVDWYPWGEEPFAKAKKDGKLVFLSVGYSSCHWCHVMERESFENEDVAKLLNDWFVCIKVDREERPDIDNIYMTALEVYSQHGGWPMSMFLTADGKPIFGGTYWPADDKEIDGQKVQGFKSILTRVHTLYTEKPKELEEQADRVATRTAELLAGAVRGLSLVELNRDLVTETVDALREEFDKVHGGFGNAERKFEGTKFPTPPYLRLLHAAAPRDKTGDAANMLAITLDHMARGGIYDQLGGGFHRYSTERTWTVPHFEKMLYDNAQLVEVYAQAYRAPKKPEYRRVVQETLAFVGRELTTPEGGFASALDADAGGEEGRFYVWTDKEIAATLPEKGDADLFKKVYGADGPDNFEGKAHILVLPKPLAEVAQEMKLTEEQLDARLAPLRQKLLEARGKRQRPLTDTKVLTAWNGLMIAGYAAAGQLLEEPKYTETAAHAADFVLAKLQTKDGRLLRTYGAAPGEKPAAKLNGYLDDYAFLVHGLLNLHDATGDKKWLDEAKALTDVMVKYHADKEGGGFFYTSSDHEKLFARSKDQFDSAHPSGNSVAARNLVRLWVKTGDDGYRALAEKTLKTFATPLKANPASMTTMAEALAMYLDAQKK
jgi:uncharacterized protein YyaL (SSP411 family)